MDTFKWVVSGLLGALVVAVGWFLSGIQSDLRDVRKEVTGNHCDPWNAAHDVRLVARIPLIVIAKWRNELGVDYWNPDHQDKVDALLNNADWRWLRTDGGTL